MLRVLLIAAALLGACHTSTKSDKDSGPSASDLAGDLAGGGGNIDQGTGGSDMADGGGSGDMAQSTSPFPDMASASTGDSVLQRGKDLYRTGSFTEPGLTVAAAATMKPDTTFNTNAMFTPNSIMTTNQGTASVLYLEKGPAAAGCPAGAANCKATGRAAGAGLFFAFPARTVSPNVVAFEETTGQVVWTATVSSGNDGVRGTPVIDPTSRRLFVIGGNNPHTVHALSVDNGVEVTTGGWPVTLSKTTLKSGSTVFNSSDQNQRGASLLLGNILYIPFGGEYGDGGNYNGWVVAIDITAPTKVAGWVSQSSQSGIWGSGGLMSDGTNIYAVTGNSGAARNVSDSEEVLRLTGMAAFSRTAANVYVAPEWQAWDSNDWDFGASTPAFVALPAGSKYSAFVVAPAKAGRLYVLDAGNLSSGKYPTVGGELVDMTISGTTGETVYTSPTIYSTSSGIHATVNVGGGAMGCATKPNGNEAIISILLQPNKTPVAVNAWCTAGASNAGGHLNYPPISTTTDGASANPIVWFIGGSNGNQLEGVDGDTGKMIVTTSGTSCDMIPSMSFPIAVKNRIVVASLNQLCSWSPNGN